MTNIKTAISINQSLFEKAEALAHTLNISRSRLFGLAIDEFIKRHQSQELLDQINAAYADESDPAEELRLRLMRRQHRQMVEDEW